jgi:predicted dehydrogenase
MDIEPNRARSLCEFYDGRYYTDDASEIFEDPEIDLVFIASNHASHADYAMQALAAGKHVHIEKPHVVSM